MVRFWEQSTVAPSSFADASSVVRVASGDYPVWVGWGNIAELGERAADLVSPPAAYVITDAGAFTHGRAAQASLEAAGVPAHVLQLPRGESSKALTTVNVIYNWLAGLRATRGDLVLAVGGGVVGDVAGFAAATYLRGMPFAQVPTSMLAMMDSSIGGKTGVDLPEGKNLVGAFHQPKFVLADVGTLSTLPERELVSGWAEAIKHGLILDEPLLTTFEEQAGEIKALDRDTATDAIQRSIAVKAEVVSRDEKETLGIRTLLNYGHTIGHALEAATGYTAFLHGEAVSIGMMGAADIGMNMGLALQRRRRSPAPHPQRISAFPCPAAPSTSKRSTTPCEWTRRPRAHRSAGCCLTASATPSPAPTSRTNSSKAPSLASLPSRSKSALKVRSFCYPFALSLSKGSPLLVRQGLS